MTTLTNRPVYVWEFEDKIKDETYCYYTYTSSVTVSCDQFVLDEGHYNYEVYGSVSDENTLRRDDLFDLILDPDYFDED